VQGDGGYKGVPLLWWKWLPIADVVGFFVPDWIADAWPGEYARHGADGTITPNFKDKLLAFAQGDVNLGYIPVLDGHLWDSLFRVLVALFLGILLGVPLGLFMGVSKFFKSFFDPMIELYRPVPPLAWAPLILTIFGIQDDGKIFLLFMVAFAIMVISARTGASGTQLSKIRASHSLGASTGQILRHVILPNAMPEILTGVRIAIGVCWGTLVAAEMLAGTTGIGFIENIARTVSDYELIWVTILIMGVLGLVFDLMMRWVISRVIPWRGKG
jgi:taurine transport system permease protein